MADPGPSSTGERARLGVEIIRKSGLWDDLAVGDALLARAAEAAFMAAPPPPSPAPCEVTLVLIDDAEMRDLNRTWRGMDAPTNVLSFPAGAAAGELPHGELRLLGDVVLAAETMQREAAALRLTPVAHASHLVVHGVLHLLGLDHDREAAAARMEALETKILADLGFADPYAELAEADAAEVFP